MIGTRTHKRNTGVEGFRRAERRRLGRMSPNEIAGLAEIAQMLGVSKRTAVTYSQRDDFPQPLDRLASGPVWRVGDIEEWAAKTRPSIRPGRPRKGGTRS